MLKRDIWNELEKWKEKNHPLILQGLRQVGKTYIVKEFGKAYYKNVVYLDLKAGKKYHSAFE
ncbi:MAG: AAA family ATPase [Erysipelotrichaceae bacterium]|nr:AAA family ATPase [Erysipelotrichaceae bacterium]